MRAFAKLLLACAAVAAPAAAADLRVAPVVVEPLAGARTATLTLINEEARPLRAQIRVMRWSERDGREVLEPTDDVVASPPLANLAPNQHYLVRLVRTAKAAPKGEEAYRVIVDEVPEPGSAQPGTVQLVLRQSIPVFFSDVPQREAQVDWRLVRDGNQLWLAGRNTGNRRLRVSDLNLDAHDVPLYRQPGLVGYVLPGSEMRWPIAPLAPLPADGQLRLRAVSDLGAVEATLVARSGA